MNTEYCICCGAEIPEGRMVCPSCENENKKWHMSEKDARKLSKDSSDRLYEPFRYCRNQKYGRKK